MKNTHTHTWEANIVNLPLSVHIDWFQPTSFVSGAMLTVSEVLDPFPLLPTYWTCGASLLFLWAHCHSMGDVINITLATFTVQDISLYHISVGLTWRPGYTCPMCLCVETNRWCLGWPRSWATLVQCVSMRKQSHGAWMAGKCLPDTEEQHSIQRTCDWDSGYTVIQLWFLALNSFLEHKLETGLYWGKDFLLPVLLCNCY